MKRIAILGLIVAVLSGLAAAVSGLGYRQELWGLQRAFGLLRWAVYGGMGATVLCVVGGVGAALRPPRQGAVWGAVGLALAAVTVLIPWGHLRVARSVPPIHDITTDTDDPPAFTAILALRADAPNPPEYGGPDVAAQQKQGYPELGPVHFPDSQAAVYDAVVETVRELGWEVVAGSSSDGRIEATDTTFWFGFKDDVVVRLTPTPDGTQVDVRSVSRVGRSDVGANAARIHHFLKVLAERLEA